MAQRLKKGGIIEMPNAKEKSEKYASPKEWLDIICKIIGALGVLISAVALVTTLYPQLILWNDNLLNKANAGHTKSQMLLAEHYFEIGEYEDSIYWYKVASANESDYQAVACNNLGYLYAKGFGLSEDEIDGFYQQERALRLFAEAYEIGLQDNRKYVVDTSRNNGLDTICFYSDECFPSKEDYTKTMRNWMDEVISMRVVVSYKNESFDTYRGRSFWEENTLYTYSGTYTGLSNDEHFTSTYYKYFGQTYGSKTEQYSPIFIFLSDLTEQ